MLTLEARCAELRVQIPGRRRGQLHVRGIPSVDGDVALPKRGHVSACIARHSHDASLPTQGKSDSRLEVGPDTLQRRVQRWHIPQLLGEEADEAVNVSLKQLLSRGGKGKDFTLGHSRRDEGTEGSSAAPPTSALAWLVDTIWGKSISVISSSSLICLRWGAWKEQRQ